jgi:hypothetical protein
MTYKPNCSNFIEKINSGADRILVYFKNGNIKEYRVDINFFGDQEDINKIYLEFISSDCDTFYNEKIKNLPFKWIKRQTYQ